MRKVMSQSSEDLLNAACGAITKSRTSNVYKKLRISPIKALYKFYTPNNVNLAGGIPLESCFPFKNIQVKLDDESSFTVNKGSDLYLNYHMSDGIVPLKNWVIDHVKTIHNPPCETTSSLTIGATDSWYQIVNLLRSECILYDQYIYGASITPCITLGKQGVGVKSDAHGIIPSELRKSVLTARANGFTVDILYLVPVGHNPMGFTIPLERKKEIYAVCQELDLIIVEDDAYYYLYYPDGELPGVRNLPKSFLSLDVDGRVIRIDTVSKVISPGMRIGWVTGPADFISKYVLLQSQCSQFPSSMSQSIMLGLVKHWGEEGLHQHLQNLQGHYKKQRDVFVSSVEKFFTPGQVAYTMPTGGMFFWLTFPTLKNVSTQQLFEAFAKADVITVPGTGFYVAGIDELIEAGVTPTTCQDMPELAADAGPDAVPMTLPLRVSAEQANKQLPCVRACYAAAPTEKMVLAIEAMAKVVRTLHESSNK